ncbi:MAG: CDP-alcohol phosphatidyltransferase family protein [Methanobacteriota archaeon]|nr:MAG: CDP-alcohol phosphatidyltransferase family protein [Euryarchaeota archaeon]
MIGSLLRQRLNKLLFPIGKLLSPINPNHITLATYPLVFIAAYFIYAKSFAYALVFVFLSSIVDNLDGAVAKANNKKTDFGSYFDAFTDKVQETTLLAAFAFSGYPLEAFLAVASSLLNSYAKARAEMVRPLGNIDWPAVGERAERVAVVFITLFVAIFTKAVYGIDTISLGLYVLTFLATLGVLQRFMFAKRILS